MRSNRHGAGPTFPKLMTALPAIQCPLSDLPVPLSSGQRHAEPTNVSLLFIDKLNVESSAGNPDARGGLGGCATSWDETAAQRDTGGRRERLGESWALSTTPQSCQVSRQPVLTESRPRLLQCRALQGTEARHSG